MKLAALFGLAAFAALASVSAFAADAIPAAAFHAAPAPVIAHAAPAAAAVIRAPAPAAAAPVVSIPWGDWLAGLVDHIGGLTVASVAAWLGLLAQRLGVPFLRLVLTDAAIERAIGAGLATVHGAVQGKSLDVQVANNVARVALIYLIDHEPVAARWLGASIGQRIVAQLGAKGLAPVDAMAAPK